MASKKFTHWNSYPFMTAPRTKYYSGQLQSPFFRLPREIRNVIYNYYSQERRGYTYDKETGKLIYPDPSAQSAGLGLILTCRIAAEEMKDVAFQKVIFKTRRSIVDEREYLGLRSRAGRFKCMLKYVDRQCCRILVCVAPLLQPEDWNDLHSHFPSVQEWFDEKLQRAVRDQSDELVAFWDHRPNETIRQAFRDALRYALDLAKSRDPPRFAKLACKVFGVGACSLRDAYILGMAYNLFVEGALSNVYSWRPTPWCIPNEDELSTLESLLCQPGDADIELPVTEDGILYFPDMADDLKAANIRWHFSAAAGAIHFLQKLSETQRRSLRTLVLIEDCQSVSNPLCHARGLIPFCIENPDLRVERCIGFLDNLLPLNGHNVPYNLDRILGWDCLEAFALWVEEALALSAHGMPPQSFRLIIDGSSKESLEAWEVIKYAAAVQEAQLELCQRAGEQPPPRPSDHGYYDSNHWILPATFAKVIRDIIQGESIVQFSGEVGEVWDPDLFLFQRIGWTADQWQSEWREKALYVEIPSRFWKSWGSRYEIEPSALSTTRRIVRNGDVIQETTRHWS